MSAAYASYWHAVDRTSGGRPALLKEEIELQVEPSVHLYHGQDKVARNGHATLTSHRVIYMSDDGSLCQGLRLSLVESVALTTGFLRFSAPKVQLTLGKIPRPLDPDHPDAPPVLLAPPDPPFVKLSFHEAGIERFRQLLHDALVQRAWAASSSEPTTKRITTGAGITGIFRESEARRKQDETTVSSAFSDLESLMGFARNLVDMSNRFSAQQALQHKRDGETDAVDDIRAELGIVSPVTRAAAGSSFHAQLARQLTDFCYPYLERNQGMLTLTDVYAMYNRARGTELISPEDLLAACQLFESLRLPLRLRTFPASGVKVLQLETHSEAAMVERVVALIRANGPMTALELSRLTKQSIQLTKEHAITAEQQELLCRDDSLQGTRFDVNFFRDWQQQARVY